LEGGKDERLEKVQPKSLPFGPSARGGGGFVRVDAGNLLHGCPEGILLLLPAHPVVSLESGQLLGWQLAAVNSCKYLIGKMTFFTILRDSKSIIFV
jgi:hypothetical protein